MALPTVHYFEAAAATGSALLVTWMTKLHELLLDAGWTIEYADSDAIGGGSSGTPAWDKTPATNVDAGVVVYRMPANGHATEWFVRLRPGWAAATSRPHLRGIQVGTGHSGGTLSGSVSTEAVPGVGTSQSDNLPWQLAVSEDGFFLLLSAQTGAVVAYAERLREPNGAVVDDIAVGAAYAGAANRVQSASDGAVLTTDPVILARNTLNVISAAVDSLVGRDSDTVVAIGPYFRGGYPLWGLPRLWFQAAAADVTVGQYRTVPVDGGDKSYRVAATFAGAAWFAILVATE